jgi:acylphosphatase
MTSGFESAARRWLVSGRVQGVGYRAFAARTARSLGLAGGASNLPGGQVLVVAEGPSHALDRLEAALWEGSRFARVQRVETSDASPADLLGEFDAEFRRER